MAYYRGRSEINSVSDDDKGSKIDLELKLGQSVYDKQDEDEERDGSKEVHNFSSMDRHSSYNMGDNSMHGGQGSDNTAISSSKFWTNEVGSTNFLLHQGFPPPNNATNRKRPNADDNKVCKACGSNNTPLWRKGPQGPQTLCNACGLRHLRTIKKGGE